MKPQLENSRKTHNKDRSHQHVDESTRNNLPGSFPETRRNHSAPEPNTLALCIQGELLAPYRCLFCCHCVSTATCMAGIMLRTQTSLQESVDGDERELESEEAVAEERRAERQSSTTYYCLYLYQPSRSSQSGTDSDDEGRQSIAAETNSMEDFSLSLLDTNLPADAEPELRGFVAKRLCKGTLFEGMGNTTSVELSVPECVFGCYYCLLQQQSDLKKEMMESSSNTSEYVVCFLGGSEKGLELFRLELDKYLEGMKEMNNLDTYIRPYLSSWFEDAVLPITRVVQLFQEELAFLLHAALSSTPVEVKESDSQTKTDINRFLSVASLQGLVQEGTMASLCIAMTDEQQKTLVIDCSGSRPQFHNSGSNKFCEDWTQAFLNHAEGGNPFLFRQKLENFKLKAIQDMNNLKRFIRQAETSHYSLFKCYMFLKNCGNGDVLLKIVKVEHEGMPEANNVVEVLEEFMYEVAALPLVS
ncbi:protein Njmu-R1 [Ambystoma mexicanum]|uniref:protein Njmu-R1 n=1 Tax=Ambystoma mexicanum TaxID=8296 RepID=UPI0037E70890